MYKLSSNALNLKVYNHVSIYIYSTRTAQILLHRVTDHIPASTDQAKASRPTITSSSIRHDPAIVMLDKLEIQTDSNASHTGLLVCVQTS